MPTTRKIPMRMCIGCRERYPKRELIRVVRRASDGEIVVDASGKISGRGAYLCRDKASCLERAVKTRALERQLEHPVGPEVYESLRGQLEEYGRSQVQLPEP